MTKPTGQDKRTHHQRYWQAHVKAQNRSGLNRAEYCRQNNLSYHALTYWQRKLSVPSSKLTPLVPITVLSDHHRNIMHTGQDGLKIILSDKIAIAVGDNFSPKTLTRLLATLATR